MQSPDPQFVDPAFLHDPVPFDYPDLILGGSYFEYPDASVIRDRENPPRFNEAFYTAIAVRRERGYQIGEGSLIDRYHYRVATLYE